MFGKIKQVSLRDIWPMEAANFTPWLAENIEALGTALGMDLELTETEASVGDFSLDVLAKDLGTSHTVIIENQLSPTDHDHLGKLLTYAAGFDASIVIWISEAFREEHRQALDWLNQRTDSETSFFGVVVEVIQIDDSKPAYSFKLVASPNEWQKSRKIRARSANVTSRGEKYRSYFQSLVDDLRVNHQFTSAKIAQPQNWYSFASGLNGITYGAVFANGGKARVEIYIDVGKHEKNKYIFDELFNQKNELSLEFGEELEWERLDEKRASRIALYCEGDITSPDSELEDIHEWHVEKLLRMKKVLGPRVTPLIKYANQNL